MIKYGHDITCDVKIINYKHMKPELQRRVQRYGWDQAAGFYDASWREQLRSAQERMLEHADLKPGEKVLETACGTGLVVFRAARSVEPDGEVWGTDISDAMIETAEELADEQGIQNVTFQRMDAEDLKLPDASFDVALSGLGLMYMPDPVQALRQKYRVLKSGGRAAVVVWGDRKNCGWADIFPIVDKRVASDVCPMFFQQGTGNTLEYSLHQAGFEEVELNRFPTTLHFESNEHLLTAVFAGGPVALAYNKFDEQTKEGAHQEYLDSVASYRNGAGYEIPGEFVVGSGRKL